MFCVGSLLQCFRVRIMAEVFGPELGSVRLPPLLHLFAHLMINTNLQTSYVSVFIRKNILNSSLSWSKSSETNLWHRLLCFSSSYGSTQHFLLFVFETAMFPLVFHKLWRCSNNTNSTNFLFLKCLFVISHPCIRCSPVVYSEFLLSFCF